MLSPIAAPTAATAHRSRRFDPPVDTATAAAATSTVSLGIGGKNPSITAVANITMYSHGEVTAWRMSSLTTSMFRRYEPATCRGITLRYRPPPTGEVFCAVPAGRRACSGVRRLLVVRRPRSEDPTTLRLAAPAVACVRVARPDRSSCGVATAPTVVDQERRTDHDHERDTDDEQHTPGFHGVMLRRRRSPKRGCRRGCDRRAYAGTMTARPRIVPACRSS